MKQAAICASLVLLLPALASACIWDSDTLQDEIQSRSSAYHVITGQVPQHSRAYYTKRLERSNELLKRASESIEVLYDVSAAHLRLGEYTKGIEYLDKVNGIAPNRYKTFSNLGVAYYLKAAHGGEQGDYESAYTFTKKALEKRHDAHFGSGWLFLKMLEWKQTLWETGVPGESFLGAAYGNRWKNSIRNEMKKRAKAAGEKLDDKVDTIKPLLTLLRAHPEFADGYLVLGMNLHNEWNLNLALWAYVRALEMGHPNKEAIHKHIDDVFEHWRDLIKHRQQRSGQRLMSKKDSIAAIRAELKASAAWLTKFQDTEAAMIAKTGDLPDFDAVTKELARIGVKRREPVAIGLVGGERGSSHGPAKGGPTTGMNSEAQGKRKAQGGKRAKPAQDSNDAQSIQPPVGGEMPMPKSRARRAPLESKSAEQPPVIDAAPTDVAKGVEEDLDALDEFEAATAGDARAADAAAAAGERKTPAPAPGMPWYVIFGLAMLGVSILAVVIGRGRTA